MFAAAIRIERSGPTRSTRRPDKGEAAAEKT